MAISFDGRQTLGTFWRGADNNVWVSGDQGVNSAGAWDDNTSNYWMSRGYNLTADPNARKTGSSTVIQPGITGGGGGGAPRPVYAPKLDVVGINTRARAAAESAVNPYYTKVLNEFLARQAADKAREQQQYQMDVTNIDNALTQTLGDNEMTRGRTVEDVTRNKSQVADTADQFQTDSGQQFDQARIQQAEQLAASGLTGGLANRQRGMAQENRNKVESRQMKEFKNEIEMQDLFKNRTFEELALNDKRAGEAAGTKKTQRKFDLDRYIEASTFAEQEQRNTLERQRLADIEQNQRSQAQLLFNQYLAGIRDPAKYAAAVQTYGGLF